jgi:hypothetical protein
LISFLEPSRRRGQGLPRALFENEASSRLHGEPPGTNPGAKALFHMIDPIEDVLAPTVIERSMSIFESFRDRNRVDIVQARKAVTQHVFGLIGTGQTDDKKLVVSALTFLKSLEARADTAKP